MIAIIDYGMGNLRSVANMLKKLGHKATITSDPKIVTQSDKIILPGIGAFKQGMENLNRMNFLPLLNDLVLNKRKKILGICLGMQLMTKWSEEGDSEGFGWFDAKTVKFRLDPTKYKVPHMGWNSIKLKRNSPLFANCPDNLRFYFVHSYYVDNNNEEDVIATAFHGIEFTASMGRENIFATQFHPEKSHKFGMCVLNNFASLE